jgi:hypothetical protein
VKTEHRLRPADSDIGKQFFPLFQNRLLCMGIKSVTAFPGAYQPFHFLPDLCLFALPASKLLYQLPICKFFPVYTSVPSCFPDAFHIIFHAQIRIDINRRISLHSKQYAVGV